LISLLYHSAGAQSHFPVPEIKNVEQFNAGVARTMNLLQTSNKENSNEVRILVYGQSISEQDWWKEVKRYLDSSYPAARINFINKAIGGFSSDRLKLTVENDVVSFYPDLILFHDYGNEEDYERIVQVIRSRTTSEIALQTDHMAGQSQEWHDKHSNIWLPELARKYGLAVIDIRAAWKKYLEENKMEIEDLLIDGVHLNDHGNYLMASVIKKYFSRFENVQVADSNVSVLKAGTDFHIRNGSTGFSVSGNRIDLIWKNNTGSRNKIKVVVDGKKPSAITSCFYSTRPSIETTGAFLRKIGQPLQLNLAHPIEEEWKMIITWSDSLKQAVGFRLQGSVTGDDGTGRSDSLFTSRSGRITIQPTSWFRAKEFAGFPWLKPGDVLKWQVKSMCADEVNANRSGSTTILQGLENGPHYMKLAGKGLGNLAGIRIYRPPLPAANVLHKKEY
jgi:hypothetical protein